VKALKKDSKARPKGNTKALKIRANNLKIIDLGRCKNRSCKSYEKGADHSHGVCYVVGKVDQAMIEQMHQALLAMGFKGELETELVPIGNFSRKYAVGK